MCVEAQTTNFFGNAAVGLTLCGTATVASMLPTS